MKQSFKELHIISFEPISKMLTSSSIHGRSMTLVRTDVIRHILADNDDRELYGIVWIGYIPCGQIHHCFIRLKIMLQLFGWVKTKQKPEHWIQVRNTSNKCHHKRSYVHQACKHCPWWPHPLQRVANPDGSASPPPGGAPTYYCQHFQR